MSVAQVHFEAFFDGIGEVMRSDEVTGPMAREASEIAHKANAAAVAYGMSLGATVALSEREKDRRPEAQVRADVDEEDAWQALTVLRKAADV